MGENGNNCHGNGYKIIGSKNSSRAGCGHKVRSGEHYFILPLGRNWISVCKNCCISDKNKVVVESHKVSELVLV